MGVDKETAFFLLSFVDNTMVYFYCLAESGL